MKNLEPNKFYRYEAVQYASLGWDGDYEIPSIPNINLQLRTYNLLRETPKGYWIGYGCLEIGSLRSEGIWVSKTSRKRFAYPTKEEALDNFIKRNQKRIKILKGQIESCEIAVMLAKKITL